MKVLVYRVGDDVRVINLEPRAADPVVMEQTELPADRDRRADWRLIDGRVVVADPLEVVVAEPVEEETSET